MAKDTKEIGIQYGWLAFAFVIFHFFLIVTDILSPHENRNTIQSFAQSYTTPFFYQKWSMFAPCPIVENRFKFRFHYNDSITSWTDPSIETLKQHGRYRFTHHGNIAVGEYNLLFWVKQDLEQADIPSDSVFFFNDFPSLKTTQGMFLLKNYLKGYAHQHYGKQPLQTDIVIKYHNVKTDSTTHYLIAGFK